MDGGENEYIMYYSYPGLPKTTTTTYQQRILAEIIQTVCREYDISETQIKSKVRKRDIVTPRQIAMYLLKNYTSLSLKTIGEWFNGRDHTTVIHSCQTVNDLIDTDPEYKIRLELVKKRVMNIL